MANSSYVYTTKGVKFSIDGYPFDVSTIVIRASLNAIPECFVGIAPQSSKGSSSQTYIYQHSLERTAKTYQLLQKRAIELATCDLEFAVEQEGKAFSEGRMRLKGWLLKNVGLSQVTTTDAFSIICTVVHPAYRLTLQTGAIYTGTCGLNFAERAENVKNPIAASVEVINLLTKTNGDENNEQKIVENVHIETGLGSKKMEEIVKTIKNRIGDVKGYVTGDKPLVKWDDGTYVRHTYNIPGEKVLGGLDIGIKYALMADWAQAMFSSSWWDALVGRIAPEYGLEILPTYDQDSLVVCPAFPWKDTSASTVTVPDNGVSAVALPGQDPSPVFGVFAYAATLAPGGGPTIDSNGDEKTSTTPCIYAFVPKDAKYSTGRLQHERLPDWIDTARELASMTESTEGASQPGESYSSQLGIPREPSSGDNEQLGEFNPAVTAHLANRFVLDYKASVTGQLDCPLLLKLQGKTLFPGQRVKFTAKGQPIFYGQIGSIVHEISCPTSTARTQILLSHCTFAGGADADILGKQPKAPYYEATGSLEW